MEVTSGNFSSFMQVALCQYKLGLCNVKQLRKAENCSRFWILHFFNDRLCIIFIIIMHARQDVHILFIARILTVSLQLIIQIQ